VRTLPLVVLVLCAGCAPALKPAASSRVAAGSSAEMNAAMAEAQKIAAMGQQARLAAESRCAPFLKAETGWEEERAIGQMLAVEFVSSSGHLYLDGATEKDPQKLAADLAGRKSISLPEGGKNALSAHVAIVGKNLARFSARPELPWVFGVIQNDIANSFAEPGGYVFVTTGLLKKMTNEAQLAGVLAHEIGHVVHKDSLMKYRDARNKQCIAATYAAYLIEHSGMHNPTMDEMGRYARQFDGSMDLDKADPGFTKFILSMVIQFLQLPNDKETEFLADRTALELVSFAGYDASEYEKFLAANPQPMHPASADRVAKLEALREGELASFATGSAKPDLGKVFAPLGQ
jgi:beta-barrel assembly-enhancing protease